MRLDWCCGPANFFFLYNRAPDKERGCGTEQLRKTRTNLAQLIPTNPLNTE